MVVPDQRTHGASRRQALRLSNLENTFRTPKGIDLWKKQSEILVFKIKIVQETDEPKTTIKMCSKLTFFSCRSVVRRCNQPKSLLLSILENEKKNGNKKRLFKWVLDVFLRKKWPKENCKKRQSNVPSDLDKGPDLPSNQPKGFSNARRKIRRERKRKESYPVRNRFLLMMNMQKVVKKQQSNVPFPLENGPGNVPIKAAFIATKKENKERGVYEQHVLCNLQHPLTYHHLSSWFFWNLGFQGLGEWISGTWYRYQVGTRLVSTWETA